MRFWVVQFSRLSTKSWGAFLSNRTRSSWRGAGEGLSPAGTGQGGAGELYPTFPHAQTLGNIKPVGLDHFYCFCLPPTPWPAPFTKRFAGTGFWMLAVLGVALRRRAVTVCNSRHKPIGVRGFLRVWGRFFKMLGRRERTKEEKHM